MLSLTKLIAVTISDVLARLRPRVEPPFDQPRADPVVAHDGLVPTPPHAAPAVAGEVNGTNGSITTNEVVTATRARRRRTPKPADPLEQSGLFTRAPWARMLGAAAAQLHECRYTCVPRRAGKGRHYFTRNGSHDPIEALQLAQRLVAQILHASERAVPQATRGSPTRKARRSFCVGAAIAVHRRVRELLPHNRRGPGVRQIARPVLGEHYEAGYRFGTSLELPASASQRQAA